MMSRNIMRRNECRRDKLIKREIKRKWKGMWEKGKNEIKLQKFIPNWKELLEFSNDTALVITAKDKVKLGPSLTITP